MAEGEVGDLRWVGGCTPWRSLATRRFLRTANDSFDGRSKTVVNPPRPFECLESRRSDGTIRFGGYPCTVSDRPDAAAFRSWILAEARVSAGVATSQEMPSIAQPVRTASQASSDENGRRLVLGYGTVQKLFTKFAYNCRNEAL